MLWRDQPSSRNSQRRYLNRRPSGNPRRVDLKRVAWRRSREKKEYQLSALHDAILMILKGACDFLDLLNVIQETEVAAAWE